MADFGVKTPADDTAFTLTNLHSLPSGNLWHSNRIDVEVAGARWSHVRFSLSIALVSGVETDVAEILIALDLGDTGIIPGNLGTAEGDLAVTDALRAELLPFDGVPMNGTTVVEHTTPAISLEGVQGFKLCVVNNASVAFAASGNLANYLGSWGTTTIS